MLAAYHKLVTTRPTLTKSLTSGVLMGSGDVFCQVLTSESSGTGSFFERINWRRAANMGVVGVGLGCYLHHWYGFLCGRLFPGPEVNRLVLKRMAVDQLVSAPLLNLGFFQAIGWLEGSSQAAINASIRDKFADVMLLNYLIWPPAVYATFRFVPASYRVLGVNCVGFCWNALLSFKKHQ